ncbi:MAG: glycosyltransferase family 2 protein [Candidatus Omnitrophota bacterium]
MLPRVLVIIPAWNESAVIANTVREVTACGVDVSVLVVDDGSVDGTPLCAAQAGAAVLRLPFNLGIGGAVQAGYRYAKMNDYDVAVQIDGDGQHDPAFLAQVLEPLVAGRADMVIGSRFLDGKTGFRSSLMRRIGIRFFSFLIRLLTGVVVTDPTSGYRACGRKLIRIFSDYYPQDYPEPEAIVVVRRLHGKVCEVPVVMRARTTGRSSISLLKSFYYMIKVSGAILLHTLKDRKVYQS